jgi:hypothetical protein
MTLLLFNLLVAIFSDVYGRIKENEEAYAYMNKNQLILDLETFMANISFWKWKNYAAIGRWKIYNKDLVLGRPDQSKPRHLRGLSHLITAQY